MSMSRGGEGRRGSLSNLPSIILSLVMSTLDLHDFLSARRCSHHFHRVSRLPLSSPATIDIDGWERTIDEASSTTTTMESLYFADSRRLLELLQRLHLRMKHLRIGRITVPPLLVVASFPGLLSLSISPGEWNIEPLRTLHPSLERLELIDRWVEEPRREMWTRTPSIIITPCWSGSRGGGAPGLRSLTKLRHLHCTLITTASTLHWLPSSLVSLRVDHCRSASPIVLRALFSHAPTGDDDAFWWPSTTKFETAVPVCFDRWPHLRHLALLDVNLNIRADLRLGGWKDDFAVLLAVAPRLKSFACDTLYLPQFVRDPSFWDPFEVCSCYSTKKCSPLPPDVSGSSSSSTEWGERQSLTRAKRPGGESMWLERLDSDHHSDAASVQRLTSLSCAPGSSAMLLYMATGALSDTKLGPTLTPPYGRRLVPDQMTSICFQDDWLLVTPALTRHLSTYWASSLRQLSLALESRDYWASCPSAFDRFITLIAPPRMPRLLAFGLDCRHLSDLSPLGALTTITSLNLSLCINVAKLPTMPKLRLLALPRQLSWPFPSSIHREQHLGLLNNLATGMSSLTTLWLPPCLAMEALHSLTLPSCGIESLDMSRCSVEADPQVEQLQQVFSKIKVALYTPPLGKGADGRWLQVCKAASERYGFRHYTCSGLPFYDYRSDSVNNPDLLVKDDCEPWSKRKPCPL